MGAACCSGNDSANGLVRYQHHEVQSQSGKKIAELEAKRDALERQLAVPGISEVKEHDIRQQLIAIDNQITALYGLLQQQQQLQQRAASLNDGVISPTAQISVASSPPALNPRLSMTEDQFIALQLHNVFVRGLEVFGQVNPPSDKLSSTHSSRPTGADALLRRELKSIADETGCVVCGWKWKSPSDTTSAAPPASDPSSPSKAAAAAAAASSSASSAAAIAQYPCPAAAAHAVSIAHILPSKDACRKVGVAWDKSNFLPLCGAKDESPSCHAAFNRFLLCFVRNEEDPDKHLWTVMASHADYRRFSGNKVDLSRLQPHRRSLHAHALHCVKTLQVKPISAKVLEHLKESPPTGDAARDENLSADAVFDDDDG